jgi:hypothetical protein
MLHGWVMGYGLWVMVLNSIPPNQLSNILILPLPLLSYLLNTHPSLLSYQNISNQKKVQKNAARASPSIPPSFGEGYIVLRHALHDFPGRRGAPVGEVNVHTFSTKTRKRKEKEGKEKISSTS